ncbi:hypothetical protein [Embleya scabrispora]|uniref:hypothetical protein n=1 Tax=Embleya scabrispora TaxID=159449 RepID=UPI00037170B3|nr:hypothetical protein [Embleya scabrispora]MYS84829.1 hypothetical protein [Streptomyces sp. SID5474]
MTADPFRVLRIEDMLLLHVEVINLRREGARLVREDPAVPALVLLHLPSQHVNESVLSGGQFPETVAAFAAGTSTLVFLLPDGQDGIDLTIEALLDWNRLTPSIAPAGRPLDDPNEPTVIGGLPRTAVEFPTRLLLGHDHDGSPFAWSEPLAEPAVLDGRAELWHVELSGDNGGPVHLKAFSVVSGRPHRTGMPLDGIMLSELIVRSSLDQFLDVDGTSLRRPLLADRFMLTPLGATVRINGSWPVAPDFLGLSLTGYEHIASLGRDEFVHTVRHGFLSSGHPASLIEITKRFYDDPGDGSSVAYLRKEAHIVVDRAEVTYGAEAGYDRHQGRQLPFRSIRLTDSVTPVIDLGAGAFWVTVGGVPLPFHATATDAEGRHISMDMPLVFASADALDRMAGVYNDPATTDRTNLGLGGQTVALAENPSADGSTGMPVTSARFALESASGHPAGVLPAMVDAVARVPAVEQLTGLATDTAVRLHDAYLEQGLDGQPTGAFLHLVDALPMALSAEKAGGLAKPSTAVQAVTTRAGLLAPQFLGAAGDAVGVDSATLAQIFGGTKLLGPIDLADLLANVPATSVAELRDLGEDEIRRRLDGVSQELLPVPLMRIADLVDSAGSELRYVWKPRLKNDLPLLDLGAAALVLEATTVRSPDALSKSSVRGELRRFAFVFADIVRVDFERLTFTARPGSKPDVTAAGVAITFEKALEFVNQLREALPADGFGSGAFVDVSTSGVTAGYSLTLPTLSLGMFNLSNVALSARLTIPFDDRPARFRFAVSERQNPFNISVSLFGGGGFFALEVSTRGIEQIEGSLEFGGNASLDLGVASGGVHLMAGIAFQMTGDSVTLTGYLRCGGYLSVLGIVSITVEFYLALTYHKDNGICEVVGQGSITVSVRVAFFSKSVSLALERRFAGSAGDPSFADCMDPDDWDEYCLAFAS